jgi:hypothetical protein
MPRRFDLDRTVENLLNKVENVRHLMTAVDVMASLSEARRNLALSDRRQALEAAERESSMWKERRQAQIAQCADAAACADRRCRRARRCTALHWISSKAEAAQARLAAERAAWPEPEADPPCQSRTGSHPGLSASKSRGQRHKPGRVALLR